MPPDIHQKLADIPTMEKKVQQNSSEVSGITSS